MPNTDTAISQRLALLDYSCGAAERLLARGFHVLETSPKTSWNDVEKAVDILVRVTAVRKSLIQIADRLSPKDPAPQTPSTPRSDSSDSSDPSDSQHPQSSTVNRQSTTPPSPDPTAEVAEPDIPSVRAVNATGVIRDIPAMPLDRAERMLEGVMSDLDEALQTWERRSPEQPDQPSHCQSPANSSAPAPDSPNRQSSIVNRQSNPSVQSDTPDPASPNRQSSIDNRQSSTPNNSS